MNDKYELLDLDEATGLHRIRALRDIPRYGVRAGDIGGLVAGPDNLSQDGDGWVFDNACVSDNGRVYDNACVFDNACVSGNGQISGNACVSGNGQISGNACVFGNGQISGNARVSGNGRVSGNARVSGDGRVSGNARVSGDGRVSGNARVFDNGRVSGNARVFDNGRVSGRRDILTISPVASEDCHLTLFRTPTGHLCQVGCWAGDLDALTDLIEGDWWPSGCGAATREAHRPEMRAVIALCRVRAATWTPREDAATETPESTPVEP